RPGHEVLERPFRHRDQTAQLLLLAQTDHVFRRLAALRLRHARDRRTLVEHALRKTLLALEEQLRLFPAAQLTNGSDISRHLRLSSASAAGSRYAAKG